MGVSSPVLQAILLKVPDCAAFPIDSEQLYFLVASKVVEYPATEKAIIDEKNKSDGLARYTQAI